jgi:uncharacterized protein DUF3435
MDGVLDFFQRAQNQVRAKRQHHKTAKKDIYIKFFENVGNHIIEQNYQGEPIKCEPSLSRVLPERKALEILTKSCGLALQVNKFWVPLKLLLLRSAQVLWCRCISGQTCRA